ncbi:hypothetical protein P6166_01085 [Stenotrophomonas sp. HITSZ_GD]|uniref:hypothetical protein n=1 Tax=Stenotrophomonas sp. HITSZ_GD TaxID=3037248 RepID=UPI00240D985C|nr:hypothetical protein [Stenotrophomonas sp. HITSZ_GD]MDG2523956.1 hypothetical protein [Stenotrophomonas sp. HITSZ_GD]
MRKFTLTLAIAASLAAPLSGHGEAPNSVTLSPNDNQQGGLLPSGYRDLVFGMWNGSWTSEIALPTSPAHGDKVRVFNDATSVATLDASATELRMSRLRLLTGQAYVFHYDANARIWRVAADMARVDPRTLSEGVLGRSKLQLVELADGAWIPELRLPRGQDGDIAVIRSSATWPARIGGEALFASTFRLQPGDSYTFEFSAPHGKWLPRSVPERIVALQAQLPSPSAPRSRVRLSDGHWLAELTLPASAGDRDRYIVESTATWASTLRVQGGEPLGPMRLEAGDRYEFMYVADEARWVLMDQPERNLSARDIPGGRMSPLTAPRTRVRFKDGHWLPSLTLPAPVAGGEVVVDVASTWAVAVEDGSGKSHKVETGEQAMFAVDANGQWQRVTTTVDVLSVYSAGLAQRLGEPAVRTYLGDALAQTNQALENSGANFRYRMVGMRPIQPDTNWRTLRDVLPALEARKDVTVPRDELKADVVYYLGTEEGCGLAQSRARAEVAFATESYGCGTNVMRHELGHVIGLAHSATTGYAQGYELAGTIMNGNAIPLYSTTRRFTPDLGMRAGVADLYDAVRAMNERSAEVAAFR